jgi:hypothetical protein
MLGGGEERGDEEWLEKVVRVGGNVVEKMLDEEGVMVGVPEGVTEEDRSASLEEGGAEELLEEEERVVLGCAERVVEALEVEEESAGDVVSRMKRFVEEATTLLFLSAFLHTSSPTPFANSNNDGITISKISLFIRGRRGCFKSCFEVECFGRR